MLNRVLIVTGLHHIINNIAWFLLGDYKGVTGDLKRFFAGDPTAGAFMSGFFPVMMFGLPGACLAMYRTATPARRAAAGGLLLSMALTSFLTGVTEPIEFAFMFLAPVLFAIHAVLTGIAMVLMHVLGVHLGFGFSAGLFDYVLNYLAGDAALAAHSHRARLLRAVLLPVPLLHRALRSENAGPRSRRCGGCRGSRRIGHRTCGRLDSRLGQAAQSAQRRGVHHAPAPGVERSEPASTKPALTALGSRGVLRIGDGAVQVVVGPIADQLASEIRAQWRAPSTRAVPVPAPVPPAPAPAAAPDRSVLAEVLAALGGRGNITGLHANSTRLVIVGA